MYDEDFEMTSTMRKKRTTTMTIVMSAVDMGTITTRTKTVSSFVDARNAP